MAKRKDNPLAKRRTGFDGLLDKFKAKPKGSEKDDEVLGQIHDSQGDLVTLRRWHLEKIVMPPAGIGAPEQSDAKRTDVLRAKFEAVKAALTSKSEDTFGLAVDTILGDLMVGAYQDKLYLYQRVLTRESGGSSEAARRLQQLRQVADTHLLAILKAVVEIKRPPVTVVVKQAEQVNVAGQINQADKQVNVVTNGQPS
jgi:hypothetical protein